MRLNFSGVTEDQIREGIRRIGEVVHEQVAMYGTLTGAQRVRPAQPAPTAATDPAPEELAKILHMPMNQKRAG
jgi:2-aminoadipate transaminase